MEIDSKVLYILIGGLIGFLSAIFKDYILEDKKEKIRQQILKKEKLEELYILISHWSNSFTISGTHLLSVMNGDIDYNQYLDLLVNTTKKNSFDFHRIDMLINIYAQELDTYHNEVLSIRDKSNKIQNKFKYAYENGNTSER